MHQSKYVSVIRIHKKIGVLIFELMGVVAVIVTLCFFFILASMHYFEFPVAGKIVVVRSGSMEPTVPLGSLAFLLPQKKYTVGEVIAYNHPDSNNAYTVVLHRIETKIESASGTTFSTKGDANNSVDAKIISQSDVVGSMKYHLVYIGQVVSWLQTQVGVLVTTIFPITLFITHYIRSLLSKRVSW